MCGKLHVWRSALIAAFGRTLLGNMRFWGSAPTPPLIKNNTATKNENILKGPSNGDTPRANRDPPRANGAPPKAPGVLCYGPFFLLRPRDPFLDLCWTCLGGGPKFGSHLWARGPNLGPTFGPGAQIWVGVQTVGQGNMFKTWVKFWVGVHGTGKHFQKIDPKKMDPKGPGPYGQAHWPARPSS